jgi:predicted nucleic acid-binding protein
LKRFVLDGSIVLAWFIDPVVALLAARVQRFLVQDARAVVPRLWRSEIANGFVVALRRRILTSVRSAQAFAEIEILLGQSIENLSHDLPIERVVTTAQQYDLTAYDATYLEIAREQQLPVATLDRKLAAAAEQAGVSLVA